MKITNILTLNDTIDHHEYGNKARWLSWLFKNGYNVPQSIFLPKSIDLHDQNNKNEIYNKIQPFLNRKYYNVAIRSSSSSEDSGTASKAGHFVSILGHYSFEDILNKIELVRDSGKGTDNYQQIAVIIQAKIDPIFSGIAFSSSPLNGDRSTGLISYVKGSNEQLTSGNEEGLQIELQYDGDNVLFGDSSLHPGKVREIALLLKQLEKNLSTPVDIEWAINENNDLILLQCRPVTNILFRGKLVFPINVENENYIPNFVKNNDKIKIRLLADKYNIRASLAHLFLINNVTDYPNIPKKIDIIKNDYCTSYSTVVLHPSTFEGKIQRLFATIELNDEKFIQYCHRYGVRAIENANSVNASLYKLVDLVRNEFWTTIIILQEFYESDYSGIIKKIHDAYLIELVKGQFIAKGLFQPTTYVLDFNLHIVEKNEIYQEMEVNINDGEIVQLDYEKPVLTSFSEDAIKTIAQEFKPLIDDRDSIIEFALLKNNEEKIIPYLYDLVDDESNSNLSIKDIASGILSPGEIHGTLVVVEEGHTVTENLHLHFHNEKTNISSDQENRIFYCKMPSISLLNLIKRYDNSKIGFVFEKGSILAHFSIVLREKKIPAIILHSKLSLKEGISIKIDALTRNLDPNQRVLLM